MYLFGKSLSESSRVATPAPVCDEKFLKGVFADARMAIPAMTNQPLAEIIEVLHRLGETWRRGSDYWNRAFAMTRGEVPFSDDMIAHSLDVVSELLHARNVTARVKADFGSLDKLDHFVKSPSFAGTERAFPLGVLFHVSAGNVFLGAIDSLLMGFLTKNVSVIKLSSRNLSFPMLFAESIREVDHDRVLSDKFALIHFPGGDTSLETVVKKESSGIIAWGGEEMILSYKKGLPLGVKFIEYGPKISFQVVTARAIEQHGMREVATWIARDIAMWDQAACASPQNLFVEAGADARELMNHIGRALDEFPFARGRLSDDEHVEILKERARAEYSQIVEGGGLHEGKDYLLHLDPRPGLRTSPLNRSLIIKTYSSTGDLLHQLKPFARYLQSCSLLAEHDDGDDAGNDSKATALIHALGGLGVMRFAHLGQVMQAPIGAPHDGKMTLVELTRIVPVEQDSTLEGLANEAIAHVPFYRDLRGGRFVANISEMPMIRGADLDSGNAEKLARFTQASDQGGFVFSSGGTSGAPKYIVYTHDEFSQVADLLATGFRAQGIRAGSVVANLFVAGNLWSSFMAVDQAMAKIGARVLPIGGLADRDQTLSWLELFKPEYVVGLPTQIVELVRRAQETGRKINIPSVLYAGEHLSLVARQFIRSVAGTSYFGSAGYASVDAGPIGYQCRSCELGVHHVFMDHVHLEVVDGEGVVTSRIKRAMPVIRLRTGDLIEWIESTEKPCACGSRDARFRLLGRVDSQINVWGCRLFVGDFEKSLADSGLEGALFQIVLKQDESARETIEIHIEHDEAAKVGVQAIAALLHGHSKDLGATHPKDWVAPRLTVVPHHRGGIPRVARTGKIKIVNDQRFGT